MGADAEIYVFDYDRYRAEVVPRLLEVVGGAGPTPWFEGVCRRLGEHFEDEWRDLVEELRERPADWSRHCTFLGDDLRHLGPRPANRDAWARTGRREETRRLMDDLRHKRTTVEPPTAAKWGQLRCASVTCPERTRCLLHEQAGEFGPDMLYWLYEAVAAECCVGEREFLGRNATLHDFVPTLRALGLSPTDPVFTLLEALGDRGGALGHDVSG
ncbi:hypothetical protein M1L60_40385 [Actinoplanes sp. TRM 88003]|uniref:Uncharacterized protein n=1 Tax=Paractinoplanes aksuensis TaxID=2939490 RepID=A0ABT1E159_9ACTN|nr:hypothetical protein [Actinoplanes aksuensis]MCO8276857.1 hypothetical protein [Actinoplanes aksuensis]